jgi:hypothetical protein
VRQVAGSVPVLSSRVVQHRARLRVFTRRQLGCWRTRCLPRGVFHSSRAIEPYPRGFSDAAPLSRLALAPACVLRTHTLGQMSVLTRHRARWVVQVPLVDYVRPAALGYGGVGGGSPLLGGLTTSRLVWRQFAQVFRGLGALCLLKLRYKGKSFKWHRRCASLMLRFGHAHLVYVHA